MNKLYLTKSKRSIFFLLTFSFFLFISLSLFSAEFTASVDHKQIQMGERIILTLTLKDPSIQGSPILDPLKEDFVVNSQKHSTSTVFMNGHVSNSVIWNISLSPKKEGEYLIPAISIHTSEGNVLTAPIKIIVQPKNTKDASESDELILKTDVSANWPYYNEPFFYTVKLSSKLDLFNVKIQQLNVEDAIVESGGEAKVHKKLVDGVHMNIIEIYYLITPLKPGSLKIPSIVIEGFVPTKKMPSVRAFSDNSLEAFLGMSHFDQSKPFALTTNETVINIESAKAGMIPWLPAKNFVIDEFWDESQTLRAGEPIVRGFKISADGLVSNQLPSLSELLMGLKDFKVYADKPEIKDQIGEGVVRSSRTEQYTLIPQQPGIHVLPAISIAWWNVMTRERVIAHIPARTINIMPIEVSVNSQVALADQPITHSPITQEIVVQRDPLIYWLMGALALLLFTAIGWGIILKIKIRRLTEKPQSLKTIVVAKEPLKVPKKDKKEKLPDLNPN